MLCLADYNFPYIIENLTSPIGIRHHWIFSGPMCDFTLAPITYLEETTGAAIKIRINNFEFWVPATWNILVTERETCQLDTVAITNCASIMHTAYCFSPTEMHLRTFDIIVVDYAESKSLVHPMINKGTALVHPTGPILKTINQTIQTAIVIGPHDLYKHLTNKVVGDLIS